MSSDLFSHNPRWNGRDPLLALILILLVSLASLAYVFSIHSTDLDGDGWSHVKRARMLSDSLTPGYQQVGTVWLPLFHVLAAPLAMNNFLWRTGLAGSLVSMLSFVVAGLGLFLILRRMIEQRAIVWLSLGLFLLNPSLLYYQTTPMQELLSMALLVLNVLFLLLWQQKGRKPFLALAAVMNALAGLNRYEGWFFIPFAVAWVLLASVEGNENRRWGQRAGDAIGYAFVSTLAPLYWFVHNWLEYGDFLEFIRGPYSAIVLYQQQIAKYHFSYPTEGHWWLSVLYYTKAMRYCCGEIPFWLALGGLGVVLARVFVRPSEGKGTPRRSCFSWHHAHLLFIVPFFFYVLSLAKGRAPAYVVDYYPYENFGVRYGHTLIPAVITLAAVFLVALNSAVTTRWLRRALAALLMLALLIPMGVAVRTQLHSLPAHEEPFRNNRDDRRILQELGEYLKPRWHGGMILMNSGYLGRVSQLDEIPMRKVVHEENRELWELMLRYPFPQIHWILAEEGDEVWKQVKTNPAYRRYYQEEKVVRGVRGHIIHVYRQRLPLE
jgi:hypothetical protein